MTQVYIPNWLFVRLEMSVAGQQVVNTFSYKYSGGAPGVTALNDFALGWWTAVKPAYQALTPTALRFLSVTVRDMGASTGGEAVYNIPGVVTGTDAGDPLPPGSSTAVGTRTATVGRYSRGRFFLPATSEGNQTNGTYTTTYMALVQALATALGSYFGPVTLPAIPVVASRKKQALYIITAFVWDVFVDSMRRRLIGRGR